MGVAQTGDDASRDALKREAKDSAPAPDPQASNTEAVRLRRAISGDAAAGTSALAFSGGGIRSATFCLGLARALAKNGVFKHFDYLSTVSGGGYVGSAIGRLFSSTHNAAAVEQGLASDRSLLLWWLRRNGRFLLPAGLADLLQAGTGYLRGLLATQMEVAVVLSLLSCFVVLPHLLMGLHEAAADWASVLAAPWWSLLLLIPPFASAAFFAFWFARDDARPKQCLRDLSWVVASTLILGAAVCLGWSEVKDGVQFPLLAGQGFFLLGVLIGLGVPLGHGARWSLGCKAVAQLRVVFTRWLTLWLKCAAGLAALGVLDLLTWRCAQQLALSDGWNIAGAVGGAGLLLVLLHAAVPTTQKLLRYRSSSFGSVAPTQLAHWVGLALSLLLLLIWLTAVQWLVFFAPPHFSTTPAQSLAMARWGGLFAVLLAYMLVSGANLETLNRAALYGFYRSRLTRAYVSTGNPRRFRDGIFSDVAPFDQHHPAPVVDFVAGDDVAVADYQPHHHGGPIHLINVCLNQTRDDQTGTYNADRKGMNLAVSSLGMELGTTWPQQRAREGFAAAEGTVAHWVAVSGAAAGSGMGSMTKTGIAALTFLTGVRLGFWRANPTLPASRLAKYSVLWREWFGSFPGVAGQPVHNLSDGGHFDNTGVYVLLKRRPALIVAADCGADPGYCFEDLENLIRKARIDYQAEIEVIDPDSLIEAAFPAIPLQRFGTPDSINPDPGLASFLLARIKYFGGGMGTLLVVKPRRINSLSVDVAGYSDRDRDFPQQTTGDQFFDESQWESYCQLGLELGRVITPDLLAQLPYAARDGKAASTRSLSALASKRPGVTAAATSPADGSLPAEEAEAPAAAAESSASSRRERLGATVRQSLGIGAALSASIAVWQGFEGYNRGQNAAQQEEASALAAVLEPQPEGTDKKRSLVDLSILGRNAEDASFSKVVKTLEEFGALRGAGMQKSAIGTVSEAILRRCQNLRDPVPSKEDDTPVFSQCQRSLVVLAAAQRQGPLQAAWDYQDDALARATAPPEGCADLHTPRVLLHDYDHDQAARMQRMAVALRTHGVAVHPGDVARARIVDRLHGSVAAAQRQVDAADPAHYARTALLLTDGAHLRCARQVAGLLSASGGGMVESQVTATFLPGLGEMQLILLAAEPVEPPAPLPVPVAAAAPPPPPPPPIAGEVLIELEPTAAGPTTDALGAGPVPTAQPSEASRSYLGRTIYIQFQGSIARSEIDDLRKALQDPPVAVPRAERIAGNYPNVVKYFQMEAQADAEALVADVTRHFAANGGRCKLPNLKAVKAAAPNNPDQLEVWITPLCP